MSELMHEPGTAAVSRARDQHLNASWSWAGVGWTAGFLAAFVIALFFLVVDVIAGHPLWTPGALGSALFLGRQLAPDASPPLVLVAGYTAIHLGVFAGFGLIAATALTAHRLRGAGRQVVLGVALFSAFELSFAAFALLFSPGLMGELGWWRIGAANALAAVAMTAYMSLMSSRLAPAGS